MCKSETRGDVKGWHGVADHLILPMRQTQRMNSEFDINIVIKIFQNISNGWGARKEGVGKRSSNAKYSKQINVKCKHNTVGPKISITLTFYKYK